MEPNHEWMDAWCARSERVIHGRAAKALLESKDLPKGDAALVVLPVWLWRVPAVDVGRKGRDGKGGTYSFPIRVDWPAPLVVISRGCETRANWSAVGMGHDLSGELSIRVDESPGRHRIDPSTVTMDAAGKMPSFVGAVALSERALRKSLESLVEDGNFAWWEMVTGLEGLARKKVHTAHAALSKDVAGTVDASLLLDDLTIESVIDRVVIGEQGEGDPPLMRILNRAMTPGTLLNADPLKYISDSLRRDAYMKVRQQIGDPHDGSKIRKIARELELEGADGSSPEIVEALNKVWLAKYPKADGLGPKRVENALGVVGSPKVVPLDA